MKRKINLNKIPIINLLIKNLKIFLENYIFSYSIRSLIILVRKTNPKTQFKAYSAVVIIIIGSILEIILLFRLNLYLKQFNTEFSNHNLETINLILLTLFSTLLRTIGSIQNFKTGALLTSDIITLTYSSFINDDENSASSSDLNANILSLSTNLSRSFGYLLLLIATIIISLFLLVAIFLILPQISFLSFFLLVSVYGLSTLLIKPLLDKNGKRILSAIKNQSEILNETSGLIKEIKNWKLQKQYTNAFSNRDFEMRNLISTNDGVLLIPRYSVDLVVILIIIMFNFIFNKNESYNELFATLATLGVAAQRLLPAIQTIYGCVTGIKRYQHQIDNIKNNINFTDPNNKKKLSLIKKYSLEQIFINIKNLTYKPSNSSEYIIKDFNLKILPKEKILIKGKSGCGKSTLLELISGAKKPTNGELKFFNAKDKKLLIGKDFYASIMPQYPYIANKSLGFNLTLEENHEDWDLEKIYKVIKISEINFISTNQKDLIINKLGSRKLSGGQMQRIGIARALYRNMGLLLLDEPTSALDKKLGSRIIKNIFDSYSNTTVVIVSHQNFEEVSFNKTINLEN